MSLSVTTIPLFLVERPTARRDHRLPWQEPYTRSPRALQAQAPGHAHTPSRHWGRVVVLMQELRVTDMYERAVLTW